MFEIENPTFYKELVNEVEKYVDFQRYKWRVAINPDNEKRNFYLYIVTIDNGKLLGFRYDGKERYRKFHKTGIVYPLNIKSEKNYKFYVKLWLKG